MKDIKLDLLDCAFVVHKVLHEAEQRIRHLQYDENVNKKCLFQMQEVAKENTRMVGILKNLVTAQGQSGNWNASPYMTGLYNGLELALSLFEKRKHEYRDVPDAVTGSGQKPTKHLDNVMGASEYIMERGRIFDVNCGNTKESE
jgi:hypothetical protein